MKRFNVLVFVLLLFSVRLIADEKKPAQASQDMKTLQGVWIAVAGDGKGAEMTFDGESFQLGKRGRTIASGKFKINPATTPKEMDLTVGIGNNDQANRYKGKVFRGIYEFDGDKLKWCTNEPGKDARPTKFVAKEGDMVYLLLTFERKK